MHMTQKATSPGNGWFIGDLILIEGVMYRVVALKGWWHGPDSFPIFTAAGEKKNLAVVGVASPGFLTVGFVCSTHNPPCVLFILYAVSPQ
jgi:hypothetical protein